MLQGRVEERLATEGSEPTVRGSRGPIAPAAPAFSGPCTDPAGVRERRETLREPHLSPCPVSRLTACFPQWQVRLAENSVRCPPVVAGFLIDWSGNLFRVFRSLGLSGGGVGSSGI